MSGFILVNRAIWDNPDFDDGEMSQREAFMWMVANAAWRETRARVGKIVVDLERGQLAFSNRFLAEKWGWSKSRVNRFLSVLEKRDTIGTDSGTGVCVITICNYSKYQDMRDSSGTPRERQAGQQRDSSGTKKKPLKPLKPIIEDTNVSIVDTKIEPVDDLTEAFEAYQSIARSLKAANGKAVWPEVHAFNTKRRSALKARIAEHGLSAWGDVLRKASASDWCCGRKGDFVASFDFLTSPSGFLKTLEGNYDNRNAGGYPTGGGQRGTHRRTANAAHNHIADLDAQAARMFSPVGDDGGPDSPFTIDARRVG